MKNMLSSNCGHGSLPARHASARRRALSALPLACLLASGAALAQEAPLDEDLQFALDNGFESFFFAQTCRSIGPDGDVIEGESLPVGNGRQLECETAPVGHLQAIDLSASTGERFCALGQLESFSGENIDPRLTVSVASAPDGAPWVLVGTSDAEITITPVAGPFGGTAFPLAADARFDVIELQPNPTAELCSVVFGI